MNFVGKILTVLICVMSLVFMTMAIMLYATHTNWRAVVMRPKAQGGQPKGLKYRYEDLKAEKENLQHKFERAKKELNTEQSLKASEMAKLENMVDEIREQRDALGKQNQKLETSTAEAVASMKKTQDTLRDMREELESLREKVRVAQKDRKQHFEDAVMLSNQVIQLETILKRLEDEKMNLAADNTRMRDILRNNDIPADEDPSGVLLRVSGQVLAVVGGDSVELSIGSDDGLKKGQQLMVFRARAGESRYMGRVEIVDTSADKAVAKIILRNGAIHEGDSVTSKFN